MTITPTLHLLPWLLFAFFKKKKEERKCKTGMKINSLRIVTAECQHYTHPQLWGMMPNAHSDLQNVINVLCNKVSIFVVMWSGMTFTVIGTATLKAAHQSDARQTREAAAAHHCGCSSLGAWWVWLLQVCEVLGFEKYLSISVGPVSV